MTLKNFFLATILGATSIMSGCSILNIGSSEYACSGMPNGVQCMSARDVYGETGNGRIPRPQTEDKEEGNNKKSTKDTDGPKAASEPFVDNYVAPRLPDRPIPIRTPSEVMRIWVAPWEDTNGDLIVTGYIYSEIETRRWVIGDAAETAPKTIRALQMTPAKAKK